MRQPWKYLSLVTANLIFCLTCSLLPTTYFLFPFPIKAQTVQSQNAEAEKLYQQATQQDRDDRYREAIQTYQQALVIYRKIGDRSGEGTIPHKLGATYDRLGEYIEALK